MTVQTMGQTKTEMLVFLRNQDILTISQRGVTTVAESFSGTGASQVITLTNNVVRNIRSVVVSSVSKSAYLDYTPSYSAGTTTITGTFTSGTNNVVVTYDYSTGTTEKVWADFPEVTYLVDNTPRIGFDIAAQRTEVIGIGSPNYISDALFEIRVYDKDLKNVDTYISSIRSAIKSAQKSFYFYPFVKVRSVSAPFAHVDLAKKVFERSVMVQSMFEYES